MTQLRHETYGACGQLIVHLASRYRVAQVESYYFTGWQALCALSTSISLMAMMASASTGNPYENYNNTEIEQDLIDPDDGMLHACFSASM